MHGEVLIALFPSRADAERAREALMQLGVAAHDVGLSAGVPAVDAGSFERLVEAGVPDDDRDRYGAGGLGGSRQTAVAVRLDTGAANRGRVVDTLEACGPLGFEGATAATAAETDFIEPEPAGWISRRVDGMPVGEPRPGVAAPAARPRVRSYPLERSDGDG